MNSTILTYNSLKDTIPWRQHPPPLIIHQPDVECKSIHPLSPCVYIYQVTYVYISNIYLYNVSISHRQMESATYETFVQQLLMIDQKINKNKCSK